MISSHVTCIEIAIKYCAHIRRRDSTFSLLSKKERKKKKTNRAMGAWPTIVVGRETFSQRRCVHHSSRKESGNLSPLAKLPYCRPCKICLPVRKCAIIVAIRRADVIFLPRFYAKEFENYVNPVPIRAVEFRVEAALHLDFDIEWHKFLTSQSF